MVFLPVWISRRVCKKYLNGLYSERHRIRIFGISNIDVWAHFGEDIEETTKRSNIKYDACGSLDCI